jgi:RND family efflux transporter MFP subunit
MPPATPRRHAPALAALVAALLLAGCNQAADDKATQNTAPDRPVKLVTLSGSNGAVTRSYSGAVRARTDSVLSFRVPGKIVARLVDVGGHVEQDTVIARVDATDIRLSLDAASANVEAARIRRDVAADELARILALSQKGFAAKSALDKANGEAEASASAYAVAVTQRDQAQNQAAYTELKADAPGIVTEIRADVGQVVAAGTPVAVVARDGEKEVAFAVPEQTVSQLSLGQSVRVRSWADPSVNFTGTVREIAGAADSLSRTFAVRVALPVAAADDGRLRLGMTATVEMSLPVGDDRVVVPLAALAKRGDDTIVWVYDAATGTVAARTVVTGPPAPDGVRVAAGLTPGERVVAAGTQFMREGLKIRPSGDEIAALAPAGATR